MNKQSGITMVALIITVIIMLILLGVGVNYGVDSIKKAKLEDIKTDMISIKTKAKIIVDEYNFKDIDELKGVEIEDAALLHKLGIEEGYIWDKETLEEQGLSTIEEDKYVVKYDTNNSSNCEVYYKDGIDGAYSLTQLQEK